MNLLVAASADIHAEEWMREHVSAAVDQIGGHLTMFGKNDTLNRILAASGVPVTAVTGDVKTGRGELRKVLSKADYVLLFWNGVEHTKLLFEARLLGKKIKVVVFETTLVVNRERGDEFDIYIGRGTPWGNPYPVGAQEGQFSRDEAVRLYRDDFFKRLDAEPDFRKGVLGMRGYRLGCFCKPLSCHGDVIAEYLNSLSPPLSAEDLR